MFFVLKSKSFIIVCAVVLVIIGGSFSFLHFNPPPKIAQEEAPEEVEIITEEPTPTDYIKWAQFDADLTMLERAYNYDVKSYDQPVRLNWIELLSYAFAKNYGHSDGKIVKLIDECATKLKQGETIESLTQDLKYYEFYHKVYSSVLAQFLGVNKDGKYGLIAFSPIAKNYSFSHYQDFGVGRTFGYNRKHLGNDLMGGTGVPIVAIEGGTVEAAGWNRYGGWRVGIRSDDGRRYYYYAHLREPHPFHAQINEGEKVQAGAVIGYMGRTGYSDKEGKSNIETTHLHLGIQLIFNEVQKEGTNQIWIDVYHIVELLRKNKAAVTQNALTKDWSSEYNLPIETPAPSLTPPTEPPLDPAIDSFV